MFDIYPWQFIDGDTVIIDGERLTLIRLVDDDDSQETWLVADVWGDEEHYSFDSNLRYTIEANDD